MTGIVGLALGFGAVLVLLAFVAVFGLLQLSKVQDQMQKVVDDTNVSPEQRAPLIAAIRQGTLAAAGQLRLDLLRGADVLASPESFARDRTAVVVEGYTDVMACHLSGVETAIATCGTAFGLDGSA